MSPSLPESISKRLHRKPDPPPLWVWGVVALVIFSGFAAWYFKIGLRDGFQTVELDHHYRRVTENILQHRQHVPELGWVVAIGRSDLARALPPNEVMDPKLSRAFGRPMRFQRIMLYASVLAEFATVLDRTLAAGPDIVVIDADLLFEDTTLFRNAHLSAEWLLHQWRERPFPFRPHGGSFPPQGPLKYTTGCPQDVNARHKRALMQIERVLYVRDHYYDRNPKGTAAELTRAYLDFVVPLGTTMAVVMTPSNPFAVKSRGQGHQLELENYIADVQEDFELHVLRPDLPLTAAHFCDATHMNLKGQEIFTGYFIQQLLELRPDLVRAP